MAKEKTTRASGPAPAEGATIKVAAIADLHVQAGSAGAFRGVFEALNQKADVLALGGDLTNLGLVEEAECLVADLAALTIPVVGVLGNHDYHSGHGDDVKKILREKGKVHLLEDGPFVFDGVGFVGSKGFGGGFGSCMLDFFGEDATKSFVNEAVNETLKLEHALRNVRTERCMVVLHYAPIKETILGEPPEIFPFLGCSRLAETLDRFDGIRAVIHGHAHNGAIDGRTPRGAPVYNCCTTLLERAGRGKYLLIDV